MCVGIRVEQLPKKSFSCSLKEWLLNVFFLQELSPERYFLESKFIPKSHARQYENELKKEFKSWADEEQSEKVK